jgi:hypothetical protein
MKKLISVFMIVISVVLASVIWSPDRVVADCEHTFTEEVVNGQRYLVERDCDGAIISMMPLDD